MKDYEKPNMYVYNIYINDIIATSGEDVQVDDGVSYPDDWA